MAQWWRQRRASKLMEHRSARIAFFVSSMLLVVVTGWVVWNEEATRRPWKQYQLEFNRLELRGVSEELARERGILEDPGVKATLATLRKDLTTPVSALERRVASIKARSPEVKQIVLEGLAVNEFKEPILTVDRCITCHLGIDRPGLEQAKQPLRTHSQREVGLGNHPIARFGCTTCHQGQGPALEVDAAHGDVEHWERPLLRGDLVQAGCRRCHLEQKQLAMAPDYSRGRQMAEDLGCAGCHTIPGFEREQKVGPDLTRIANKVDPSWLVRWIKEPTQYLSKTKMPNFGLSDDDALSIAAYLLKAPRPLPELQGGFKAVSSVERGREIVGKVGCLGCHRIAGMEPSAAPSSASSREASIAVAPPGGLKPMASPPQAEYRELAPDLSLIAGKVNAGWLFAWLKNPKRYSPTTRMPDLGLSDDEAGATTAFLMTLGRQRPIGGLREELRKTDRIVAGERVIRKYGCFGCHNITGFEAAERIAPDLSDFGRKRVLDLFFGDAVQVKQTWEEYAFWKLKNPRIYATERVEQVMPDFNLTDGQTKALRVFLKSLTIEQVQPPFQRGLSDEERAVQNGRSLVRRYNCNGCHIIEGQGGAIAAFYADKTRVPPPLEVGTMHEGEKVQATWLYQFLGQPAPLRPWLDVRMPTFGLSIGEATALTAYFAVMGRQRFPYEYVSTDRPTPQMLKTGRLLMSKEFFDCFSCHQQGEKKPEGPPEGWAPDLNLAQRRLRPLWIAKWLKNPQHMQPGTKMPSYFPGGPKDILEGNEDRQIHAISEYLMHPGGG